MKTYIALFRGINVGGKNMLPMQELRSVLEKFGARNAKTYIQSGNAVFQFNGKGIGFADKISAEIGKRHEFKPYVLLLDSGDLERVIAANPFREAEAVPKNLHIIFLSGLPKKDALTALEKIKKESEQFRLKGNVFYLHAPEGVGRSKLVANMERQFGVPTTGRNWRTVTKIVEMVKEQQG